MSWLVDYSVPVYLLLVVVALGFGFAAWHTKRVKYLAIAGGVLAAVGLFWLLTQFVVTDRRQIEQNVYAMADAAATGDVNGLFQHLAPDLIVQRQPVKRDALRQKVGSIIKTYQLKEVYVSKFEVEELDHAAGKAKVNFMARVDAPDRTLAMPWCVTEFVRLDGQWKLRAVEFRNSFANTDQLLNVPLP